MKTFRYDNDNITLLIKIKAYTEHWELVKLDLQSIEVVNYENGEVTYRDNDYELKRIREKLIEYIARIIHRKFHRVIFGEIIMDIQNLTSKKDIPYITDINVADIANFLAYHKI